VTVPDNKTKLYNMQYVIAAISEMLRSVEWQFGTDVSGQPVGPIFKSETS